MPCQHLVQSGQRQWLAQPSFNRWFQGRNNDHATGSGLTQHFIQNPGFLLQTGLGAVT